MQGSVVVSLTGETQDQAGSQCSGVNVGWGWHRRQPDTCPGSQLGWEIPRVFFPNLRYLCLHFHLNPPPPPMSTSVPKPSCLLIPLPLRFLSLPFSPSGILLLFSSRYHHIFLFQKWTCKKISFGSSVLRDIFQTRALTYLTLPLSSSSIYQLCIFR